MTPSAAAAPRVETASPDEPRSKRLRRWALVLALFAFATAWNLTKAYHIDDTVYVDIAQWIAANPLHPMRGTVFWGEQGLTTIDSVNQPHLYFYAMALWGNLFGWSEVSMHSLMALCALSAIALMLRLSQKVVPGQASLATALVVASPAFVVDQNTMVDVPALALWLLFFVMLLGEQKDKSDRRRYVVAGVVCGAAILVKYTGLVLLPALVLDGLLRRRPAAWYGVAVAIAIVLSWCAFNYWDYGGIHMLTRMDARGFRNVLDPRKWILCLGAALPFSFALACAWLRRYERSLARAGAVLLMLGVAALLAIVAGALAGAVGTSLSDEAFVAFFIVSGSLAVVLAAMGLPRLDQPMGPPAIDRWVLGYWAAGAAAFIVLFAPFIAMRHVLFALPAIVLLVLTAIGQASATPWKVVALVTAFVSTSVVASADRWYAGIYRDEARRLRNALPATARVWTTGHWGWQWYAAQNGMPQVMPRESQLAVGDFIIYPDRVHRQPLPAHVSVVTVREIAVAPTNAIRAFASPYAGFYATSAFTQLPWAVQREPIETFHILRVESVGRP